MVGHKTREEFHREFGGFIYEDDFGGKITMNEMAIRIAMDVRLNRTDKREIDLQEYYKIRRECFGENE